MHLTNSIIYFIVNSIDPYKYDINQILALPNSFGYRLRYKKKWVSETVVKNFSKIRNSKILIVLRDIQENKLFPIRYATISNCLLAGDIYYFEFTLDTLVRLEGREKERKQQLIDFNSHFIKNHTELHNFEANKDMSPLVIISKYIPEFGNLDYNSNEPKEKDLEDWGNILDEIKNIKAYENIEFVKILWTKELTGDYAEYKSGEIKLKAGSTYDLYVFQKLPSVSEKTIKSSSLRLEGDTNYFEILRHEQSAVGKYDILRFSFRTKKNTPDQTSFFEMLHSPSRNSDSIPALPSYTLPVFIHQRKRWIFIRCIIAVFSIIFIISPNIAHNLISNTDLVSKISLIILFFSFVDFEKYFNRLFK